MMSENPLAPRRAEVVETRFMTEKEKLIRIRLLEEDFASDFRYGPGQFVKLGLMGLGEAPISICTAQRGREDLEFCIRNVGSVTRTIHRLSKGDTIWIRGPYGNGFPMNQMEGRDLILVAGGLGIAPVRSVLHHILLNRERYGEVTFLYGVRSYDLILFRDEILDLMRHGDEKDVRLYLSYEDPNDKAFKELACEMSDRCTQGVVTKLFGLTGGLSGESAAVLGGPPNMYKFVVNELNKLSINPPNVYMTLERRMHCGIGQCGHCIVGTGKSIRYVCKDGPVFTLWEAMNMRGLI